MRERDDVACIVYSSGTGGTPKGCMLTHDNYLAQAEVLGRMYPMKEEDRYFSILPTNHAIDFMCGFIVPLLFGGGRGAPAHAASRVPDADDEGLRHHAHGARAAHPARPCETKIEEQLDEREPTGSAR